MTLHSMPLAALEAVVLDTETTGLDARTARLLQIGALRLSDGRADLDRCLETLVDPGCAVPPASTAIHGIRDEDLKGAPSPAEALKALEDFRGNCVIVGHTINYDLTILGREAELAGLTWSRPPALDVRHLARIANPNLADHGLDSLCSWLGIEIEGRHSAMGDAVATAQVFCTLVPLLRQAGLRTLAEAETAAARMAEREAVEYGEVAGPRPAPVGSDRRQALERIDSYPYRHRVGDVMSSPPVTLGAEKSLEEALPLFVERGVSSLFVVDEAGETGIVTERDVLRAVAAKGAAALEVTLGALRQAPLHTIGQDDFVYRAIGRMDRHSIRHLGVTDASGALVGAVTTRNLLRHRVSTAMLLGDEIDAAGDEVALAKVWAKLPLVARRLSEEEVAPSQTAAVISTEICLLTGRAAALAERRMIEAGHGASPTDYAVLVLGSAGRGESLLSADQDNAIVYRAGEPGGAEDRWLEKLGAQIADILDEVGVPYCKGGVMARNAEWRKSLAAWEETVAVWISRQRPEDLMNVDIFFDGLPVYGDAELGEALRNHAYAQGSKTPSFTHALAGSLRGKEPPLSFFGRLRTGADERLDLKLNGVMPITAAARILSIKSGNPARSTEQRLKGAAAADLISADQAEALIEAHKTLLGMMLAQQLDDSEAGVPPGPRIKPQTLSKAGKDDLREALRRIPDAVDLVREGMF